MEEESKLTKGIILSRQPKHEADMQLRVFTWSFGKLDLVARGLRRPGSKLAGHLEPFNLCELLLLHGRNHNYVASAWSLDSFCNLKSDLNKIYFAGQAVAVFDRLVRFSQVDQSLFILLQDYLESLSLEDEGLSQNLGLLYYNFFLAKLIMILGTGPELSVCVRGGESIVSGQNYLDVAHGGLVCRRCFTSKESLSSTAYKIGDNTIKLLRLASDFEFSNLKKIVLNPADLKELNRLLKLFLEYNYSDFKLIFN